MTGMPSIGAMLPGKATDVGATAKDNRLFVEAVLWIARTAVAGSAAGLAGCRLT